RTIDSYSGHADRDELVNWARPLLAGLSTAMLVHGEADSIAGLADALATAGLPRERVAVPLLDQSFDLVQRDGRWTAVAAAAAAEAPRLRPEEASARRDWHNDYAQILLDLRGALRTAPDDHSRRRLLRELRRVVGVVNGGR
ncbi:MAG: MBL fold metallo-hydrolase RNA specificity domain-containing protein, partial [Chloroflexota bacterium]|nr:MBL fold metallo-hydrolase RNA specificity domain-containing protein [Chloroflexota bacterium]